MNGPTIWLMVSLLANIGMAVALWRFVRTNRQRRDELKHRQQAQIDDKKRIAIALEGAGLGFWEWDIATDSFRLSARSLAMFGLTSDEEVGATHAAWQARIHPEDLPVDLAKVRAYQENPSERLECEYRVRHRSGVWIWVLDRGRWLGDAGRQLIVGTLLDISSRKEMEQQLLRMAITDPLTGLSNRRAFNERLQLEWERLKRSPEIQAALVLCDIDHFKRINDTYGHGCSDEVLKHFASRLREHVRATDMAARIGGEEFAVLLEAASIEDAQVWAERFRQDTAATAVVCGDVSISYSASMGVALLDPRLRSVEQVMQQADSAL
ncbi:GGDEF domain-containing protein [Pseudomonas aeruginosa]|uniref:GGDEF domain-containing protein n=1 Tax=Pseudomonas aeruginosa TaxID=287 RepID=UPI0020C70BB1|nr:diguanylate cyclase [Pseudomonas aeruginosa]